MSAKTLKTEKARMQKRVRSTRKKLKKAALNVFTGKGVDAATVEELEEPYLCYLEEIENKVSIYLSSRMDLIEIRRLACAAAGFVFGFFSFAMIVMTSDEMETSVKTFSGFL